MKRLRVQAPRLFIAAAGLFALSVLVPVGVRALVGDRIKTLETLQPAQAALVLGASIVRGEPSPILAERLDTAIALYRAGTVKKILVSGDNGESTYDEVSVMLAYVRAHGVPDKDIFFDRAGFDTYSSMYRARHVFGANHVIIPTQDFHLPRAVFLAQSMGLDAQGVVAGTGGGMWDYLREVPATVKAVLDVLGGRQPKYLGAPIPLSGRGNALAVSR